MKMSTIGLQPTVLTSHRKAGISSPQTLPLFAGKDARTDLVAWKTEVDRTANQLLQLVYTSTPQERESKTFRTNKEALEKQLYLHFTMKSSSSKPDFRNMSSVVFSFLYEQRLKQQEETSVFSFLSKHKAFYSPRLDLLELMESQLGATQYVNPKLPITDRLEDLSVMITLVQAKNSILNLLKTIPQDQLKAVAEEESLLILRRAISQIAFQSVRENIGRMAVDADNEIKQLFNRVPDLNWPVFGPHVTEKGEYRFIF